jgi:CRP-like cAMP-binding protein
VPAVREINCGLRRILISLKALRTSTVPSIHLSRSERIQRIGELLSKGVALLLSREAAEKQSAASKHEVIKSKTSIEATKFDMSSQRCNEGEAIINYLRRVGSASPRDMQGSLGLSKTTLFRRLDRLIAVGVVIRSGRTTAIRYGLPKSLP